MRNLTKLLSVAVLTGGLFWGSSARAANVVDTVVDRLCAAAERCDLELSYDKCVEAMNGVDGKQIWDQFGIMKENQYSTAQIRQWVKWGVLIVSSPQTQASCLDEIDSLCLREESDLIGGDYANIENLIDDGSSCNDLLTTKPLKSKN